MTRTFYCDLCGNEQGAYPFQIFDWLGRRRKRLCDRCYKRFELWLKDEQEAKK